MKYKILFMFSFSILLNIYSCQKDINTYNGKTIIYFNDAIRLPASTSSDSLFLSFSLSKAIDSIVNMVVGVSGAPVNYDREYKLVIDPLSTARAGEHYNDLPSTFSIKKNRMTDTIKLTFHRTADLQNGGVTLIFNLEPNHYFSTDMKDRDVNKSIGKKHSFIKYKYFVNDITKKPAKWTDAYLGRFTRKKLELMIEVLGIDPNYLDTSVSFIEVVAYARFMQRYLNDEHEAGRTVYEADGTGMVMGSIAQ